jgi:hypothetical protein
MPFDSDPDHPIIDRPFEYEIVEFCYQNDPDDSRNTYLDLTLRRGTTVRRLRFLEPQDLEIEKGFPRPTGGMCILDVRHRPLEGIQVRVADFEASWGKVTFWAREALDLDAQGRTTGASGEV